MAQKSPNAGDLRTAVLLQDRTAIPDGQGYDTVTWWDIFGGAPMYCRWTPKAVGDTNEDGRIGVVERAQLTFRQTDAVTATCRICRSAIEGWWYSVGAPVSYTSGWVELTVERKAVGV